MMRLRVESVQQGVFWGMSQGLIALAATFKHTCLFDKPYALEALAVSHVDVALHCSSAV